VTASWTAPAPAGLEHLDALNRALRLLESDLGLLERWAAGLADVLQTGGRLLAVGNGGSAAQAQHLTSELVGRYCNERHPFSAISLHADTSSLTAISNDYGVDAIFARQVLAHGRRGDVLVALSTSGHSPNVVTAAEVAMTAGLQVWALTGPGPNPLADRAHQALCVQAETTATIQEVHLVVVHLLCSFLDEIVGCGGPP
jgi:D-sedoheptulose 7-phosphate isomerase